METPAYPRAKFLAQTLVTYYLARFDDQKKAQRGKTDRFAQLLALQGKDAKSAMSEASPVIFEENSDSEHFDATAAPIRIWLRSEEQRLKSSLEGATNASEYAAKCADLYHAVDFLVLDSGPKLSQELTMNEMW